MKQKLLCISMMLMMLCISINVKAVNNGTCGDNLTWELSDDGTLTISGTGDMINWNSQSSVPWYSFRSSIKSAIIKEGVRI